MTRYDNRGRELHTGEYQRQDGVYEYKYIDRCGKRKSVTAFDLEHLRSIELMNEYHKAVDTSTPLVEVKDKILLDIDEAVALFGLPRNHLYDIAKQHPELTYTTGRNIHFKRAPLEQFILSAVN